MPEQHQIIPRLIGNMFPQTSYKRLFLTVDVNLILIDVVALRRDALFATLTNFIERGRRRRDQFFSNS